MKKLLNNTFILLITFLLCSSITSIQAQEKVSYFFHTVEKGQSLYSISLMYNVSQADIARLNPGCDEKVIAGEVLKIPQQKGSTVQSSAKYHTIAQGETLYKLTTIYKVSAQEICEANPGLTAENFQAGEVIRIPLETSSKVQIAQPTVQGSVTPKCQDMHKVKRKETIYSICHQYGITEKELMASNSELKDGLKKGQFLFIPYPTASKQVAPTNKDLFNASKQETVAYNTLRVALMLPFTEDKRMTEYYEGFLIAVDSLKRMGTSIDLYVYNCPSDVNSLKDILNKEEMKRMHLIIGPQQLEYTDIVSDFAKKNRIRLVIPFSSKDNEVFNNPLVYQVNTPQSYLYSEVQDHFLRQFNHPHVIFVRADGDDQSKSAFIKSMEKELGQKGITMNILSEQASIDIYTAALKKGKQNVFVPTSGNDNTLSNVLAKLKILTRNEPDADLHLFGYPEWQTRTKQHFKSFFEVDTYFYSSFFTNNLLPEAVRFNQLYHHWYNKEMRASYPKYGMLGFDTGYFFLRGLSLYGSDFEKNLKNMNILPIQTGFKFERVNNWGGFVNKKVFFIHFNSSGELIKLDYN